MTRKKNTKTIVIAAAITILLSGTAAFAYTTSNNTVQAPKFVQTQSDEVSSLGPKMLSG